MIVLKMDQITMEKEYLKIVEKLGLNVSADISSSQKLEFLLKSKHLGNKVNFRNELSILLQTPCLIAGGGPSIEQDLRNCIDSGLIENMTIIAVDGTVKLLCENQIIPHILVTDLDGDWLSIHWAMKNHTRTLIHAHGDNQHLISKFFTKFQDLENMNNIWGTTQNYIASDLYNFGGFTDGDRAIFLAFYFQSPVISLIGFDFGNHIGKYSLSHSSLVKDIPRKLIKFEIALNLLEKFFSIHQGKRFNLTNEGLDIPGFPRLAINEFNSFIESVYKKQNNGEFPK